MRVDDEEEKKLDTPEEEKEAAPEKEAGDKEEVDESKEEVDDEGKKEEEQPKNKLPPWMKKRLSDYTKRYHDQRRKAEVLEAENLSLRSAVEELRRGGDKEEEEEITEPIARRNPTGKTDDQLVEERANQIVKTERFTEACNKLYDAGEKQFKDWGAVMENINTLGGFAENPTALSVILELPDSHKIVHALGKDPELADKIFQMSPVRMTVELTKLSDQLSKPKREEISDAPDPIKPLKKGKVMGNQDPSDQDTTADWMAKREAQLAARNG